MEKLTHSSLAFMFVALVFIFLVSTFWFLASEMNDKSNSAIFKEDSGLLPFTQIKAIKKRLRMTLTMEVMGVSCFLLCVVFVYFIINEYPLLYLTNGFFSYL